jgi:hypothetical protein
MKKSLIFIAFLTCLTSMAQAQESAQKLYRIHVTDFSRIKNIESTGISVYNQKPGSYIEVLALPEQIQKLDMEGATVEFIANSFKELYSGLSSLKSIPPFHGYQGTLDELADIAGRHPEITKLDTIGYSVLGRAICCLKISDNPGADEDEPPVLFVGNHHGNEIHSVEATLYQINYLVDNYGSNPEVTQWVNSMEIWYIPMTNPDGREAMERGNNHGVDLNRNYSFGFTAGGGHGPEAFSEPETRAIRDFTAEFPPIMSLSYHTSGQYLLYPWTHTDEAAPDSSAMTYLGKLISDSITVAGGHYTLLQGGRWYFTAGEYCDYMYVTHNTLAYTVEMGVSQAPDNTVMPEMSAANLKGMKTMLRQVNRAGVTGLVTDSVTGMPIAATVDIPAIGKQGKVPLRTADVRFGRFYRYLRPGTYTFEVTAPGYRTIIREVNITPDSLTHWNIKMERSAFLKVDQVILSDKKSGRTSGNGDGLLNAGEMAGLNLSLANRQEVAGKNVYLKVASDNPHILLITDSIYFGSIEGNKSKFSPDTILFRIDPNTPDAEDIDLTVSIGDTVGTGWFEHLHLDVHAPNLLVRGNTINDSDGNQNGVFDNGEKVTLECRMANSGRQAVHDVSVMLSTRDTNFEVLAGEDAIDSLGIGEEHVFLFRVGLAPGAPKGHIGDFKLELNSAEGYAAEFNIQVNNILGFYDNFENGVNGWSHASYGTTSNNHDDWQLGTPAGKAGDPGRAFSGLSCWGNDMGWDSYEGTSWDGLYQNNVYNYLSSPLIDCSALNYVGLKFMRWLNVRISDYASIRVNNQLVWESPDLGIIDTAWTERIIDISKIADRNPWVTITFELKSNATAAFGGWNIDDVIVADGLASGASSVEEIVRPAQDVLENSQPNPFSSQTHIGFYTAADGPVELSVIDRSGLTVRKLVSARLASGRHQAAWDGKNGNGMPLPAGVYIFRLKTGQSVQSRRTVLLNQ